MSGAREFTGSGLNYPYRVIPGAYFFHIYISDNSTEQNFTRQFPLFLYEAYLIGGNFKVNFSFYGICPIFEFYYIEIEGKLFLIYFERVDCRVFLKIFMEITF